MAYFLVDLWMDGYEDDGEMKEACLEFIVDQLDMTASSVHAYPMTDLDGEELKKKLKAM